MASASPWSWVMKTKVTPVRFWMARNSARMFWRSLRSSAESGSSSSITDGSTASARAMATRCFWPPDKLADHLVPGTRQIDQRQKLFSLGAALGLVDAAHFQPES